MRYFAILLCVVIWGAAQAAERPILQIDTGGHTAPIVGISFTADGNYLISASQDKVIRIWDWRSGKTLRTLRGESEAGRGGVLYRLALSPDGSLLAAAGILGITSAGESCCGEIRLFALKTGQIRTVLTGHEGRVYGLAFSPDGKYLISGSKDKAAIIWDVSKARLVRRLIGHTDGIEDVGFTPDGKRAVTASFDKTLRLWNVADGTLIAEMRGHADRVRSLSVSPSDGSIVSGDYAGEIRVWDGKSGRYLRTLGRQEHRVYSISISPDGKKVLSTSGEGEGHFNQYIWDFATGRQITRYERHDWDVLASGFSPDGGLVATAGGNNQEIDIWDPRTGETKSVLKGTGRAVLTTAFSLDGNSIAWGTISQQPSSANNRGPLQFKLALPRTDGTIGTPEVIANAEPFFGPQSSLGPWSLQDQKSAAYGFHGTLKILKDGKLQTTIERGAQDGYEHAAYSFTPDGKTIISGGFVGQLSAYGLDGKRVDEFKGHEGDIQAVACSPDGRYLISGSADQTVRLWNLKTRELLVTLFRGEDGEWVMWTPEGFYTGSEGAAKIVGWQINQGSDKEARYVTAGQFRKVLYRPDLVAAKIQGDPKGLVKKAAAEINLKRLLKTAYAPEIEILSPSDGTKLGEGKVSVSLRVLDEGGGVGTIRVRLNGQAVDSFWAGKAGTFTRTLDLATPDTEIEIIALDRSGKIESMPAAVTVHADAKAILGVPDLYVLAIGVDRYQDLSKRLNFAVKDAEALAGILKEAGDGFYRHPPIAKTLFDDEVTAENVEAAFSELKNKVKATDVFLFYMAGHGKTLTANADYYFLPPSMDGFSDAKIKAQAFGPTKLSAWFESIKAQKSIWIFDTCESGSVVNLFRDATSENAGLQRLIDATGRTIFMAAGAQQIAAEGYCKHGLLTYALLEGFAKAGAGDKVQIFDLADYVQTRVPELSRKLKACEARGPKEYCQKPIVGLGSTPNYPILPRHQKVLDVLCGTANDTPEIRAKNTYALRETTALLKSRGVRSGRQIDEGEEVTVIKIEDNLAQIAQDGKLLGYVDKSKLLKLKK
ncbi:MAG: caspase family protein [Rhodomicrobium sp.]